MTKAKNITSVAVCSLFLFCVTSFAEEITFQEQTVSRMNYNEVSRIINSLEVNEESCPNKFLVALQIRVQELHTKVNVITFEQMDNLDRKITTHRRACKKAKLLFK